MNQTAFLMKNLPPKEEELICDFVESQLEVGVTRLEYSVISEGTALIVINDSLDIDDIAYSLEKDQDLLDDRTGPLEVFDAGYCDDAVVIYNLDEELLSIEFLQLYIESTFADGYEAVSNCELIPNIEKTALVTFSRKNVIPQVLEFEDQVPLRSMGDYHIQAKPFYQKFYCTTEVYPDTVSELEPPIDSATDEDEPDTTHDGNQGSVPLFIDPENIDSDNECFHDAAETPKEPAEGTLKLPKIKWRLLKGKLQAVPDCQIHYDKEEEILHITSEDLDAAKLAIIDMVGNVKKASFMLSKEQGKFLKDGKVNGLLDSICSSGQEKVVYEITGSSFDLCGVENVEEKLQEIRGRLLYSSSIKVQKHVPNSTITECHKHCKSFEKITVSFDDDTLIFLLTGLVEDVTIATDEIKKMLAEYDWKDCTFTLEGKEAVYVNKHANDQLENLLKNAEIKERTVREEEIRYSFKCRKVHERNILKDLNTFRETIIKTNVALDEFDREELKLMNLQLKKDDHVLNEFETSNTCCVFAETCVKGAARKPVVESSSSSVDPPEDDLFSRGEKRVLTLGPSCTIQILPVGNIIKEKSDLLICGLHGSLNMKKTRVSMAFQNADGSLQDEVKKFDFSQNGVFVSKRSLSGTNCQAIAFIVLETWQQGMSEKKLMAAVAEVLEAADTMGLSSASIPPLGSGQALKYPSDSVATAVANSIEAFLKTKTAGSNCVKEINLLAPDRQLFTEISEALDEKANIFSNDVKAKGDKKVPTLKAAIKRFFKLPKKKSDGEEKEETLTDYEPFTITIVHCAGKDDIALKLKNEMRKQWLVVDYFKPGGVFCWPPQFMNDVTKAAKKYCVKIEKREDSSTKHSVCKIKGRAKDVQEMKNEMLQLVLKMSQEKKLIFSFDAPQRDTVKFIDHVIACDSQFPSYWKLKVEDFERNHGNQQDSQLHKVDQAVFEAIETLVLKTWDSSKVGNGYDAANIPHQSQVKVISVERLENPVLFSAYFGKRRTILRDMQQRGRLCQDIGQLQNTKGPSQIAQHSDNAAKKELIHEINEQYFFHGTREKTVDLIRAQGLDSRLSSQHAMFGQGVYLAESSTKADQYADDRDKRLPNGSNLFMFLSRVTLGDVFLCDDKHGSVQSRDSQKLKRPPCLSCLKDVCVENCTKKGRQFYHSVMGDGKWIFREFVVYSNEQCYPEYLIKYQRV